MTSTNDSLPTKEPLDTYADLLFNLLPRYTFALILTMLVVTPIAFTTKEATPTDIITTITSLLIMLLLAPFIHATVQRFFLPQRKGTDTPR